MKLRDSGMPDEAYWETLFDVTTVVDRLETELQPEVISPGIGPDQGQRLVGDAVRPRSDGKADHLFLGEGLVVERPKLFRRSVSVREGLKIGNELPGFRAAAVEGFAPADLVAHGGKRACLAE